MTDLPVTAVLPQIKKNLLNSSRLVLQAPPGAGKTSLVPIALLDQPWLAEKKIIMLEPRRLAARNAAARMAYLLGEKLGERVGYQIRSDRCVSEKTKILVVTEGILTRMLQADPELEEVALVIFDEFHERNLHADLALAFCLQSQELLREDLKILLMSATLNTKAASRLLGDAPIVESKGRSFPVETIYMTEGSPLPENRNIAAIISQLVVKVLPKHGGNFLIFLPGVGEIKQLQKFLVEKFKQQQINDIDITPLYGDLSQSDQDKAIKATIGKSRKLVLATNIAETSLTIDGISVVIDSGLQRLSIFNPRLAMNSLTTAFISQDSATQRSGRAGRLGAGTCYRLWTESKQLQLAKHQTPEILHSDLTQLALELAQWGVHEPEELKWLDLPGAGAFSQARDLLLELAAIKADGQITAQGKVMLNLGVSPRIAHMLVSAAELGYGYEACVLAALLTEKDIYQDKGQKTIAIRERMQHLISFKNNKQSANLLTAKKQFNTKQCQLVLKTAGLFYQRLKRYQSTSEKKPKDICAMSMQQTINYESSILDVLGILLAYAYPDRIAQSRNAHAQKQGQNRYLMSSGKGAYINNTGEFINDEYIVVASLDGNQQGIEARVFLAAEISLGQLQGYFPSLFVAQEQVSWNKQLQRVEARKILKLGEIVISKQQVALNNSDLVEEKLLEGVQELGLDCLDWSKKVVMLKQRVDFLNYQKCNNNQLQNLLKSLDLPDFSDEYLASHLKDWLQPYLEGQSNIKQLQGLDFFQILLGQLDWQQQQMIEEFAPTHIQVPSASRIAIDYSDPEKPTLAVRLQELYGNSQTPSVLKGQFSLLLHLLSPAMRPMQVTDDLASFWKNTYPQVKKELQGKYKKHYWPDDPSKAKATNKIKRFMD